MHIKINNTGNKHMVNICTHNSRSAHSRCIARLFKYHYSAPQLQQSSFFYALSSKNCTEHTETNYCTVKPQQEHHGICKDVINVVLTKVYFKQFCLMCSALKARESAHFKLPFTTVFYMISLLLCLNPSDLMGAVNQVLGCKIV